MNDKDLLRDALDLEATAHRALLDGDDGDAATAFLDAADCYRRSWESAAPAAYGRLVGMLKATILGGGDVHEAANYARRAIADPASPRRRPREPEHEPDHGRLAAAVRAGDRDELALRHGDAHVLEHRLARSVGEGDALELDRGLPHFRQLHPRPSRNASRFARITVK